MGRSILLFLLSFLISAGAWASSTSGSTLITAREREKIRFLMENEVNALELVIRNQSSARSDLRRQEKDVQAVQLYRRIPFKPELDRLEKEVRNSAQKAKLKIVKFRRLNQNKEKVAVPASISTVEKFELPETALAERLPIEIEIEGSEESVKNWSQKLIEEQDRLLQMDQAPEAITASLPEGKSEVFRAQIVAFRFREIQYPKLKAPDPLRHLPPKVRKQISRLKTEEPQLGILIEKAHQLKPKAEPLLQERRPFLLRDAHMRFFMHVTQS